MSRFSLLIVFLMLLSIGMRPVQAGAPTTLAEPTTGTLVQARSALIMDVCSGMVLYEQQPDIALSIASTTKIVTAMVILDHGADRLDETVTVSKDAFATGGSSVLAAGDQLLLRDVLRAALIRSSNEATVAAAEHLTDGHADTFVGWMNEKADEILGPGHTSHFANPHGLYNPAHVSTARELGLLAREALTNPKYALIREIVATGRERVVNGRKQGQVVIDIARLVKDSTTVRKPFKQVLISTNNLLHCEVTGVPGCVVDGVKTGYVRESGKCLVASATRNGWQLLAVVLNSPASFTEADTLLQYGFTHYGWRAVATPTRGLSVPVAWGATGSVELGAEQAMGLPEPIGGRTDDRLVFREGRLQAPVRKGAVVGTLELRREGRVLLSASAIALRDVPVAWWVRTGQVLLIGGGTAIILLLAGKLYGTRAKIARRRRRQLATGGGAPHPRRARDGEW